ncbi:hypothetical protein TSAR_009877 [Trichomalopsis sarcophagae]|uniref:Uncharacterized protein n=1 Tax=Trichomalopsis sarcophagae TaxID=543379 RepID=A0A232FK43_9HYME|nr:hypothetical protein TSAR_009877 [Trichomalopsis sarcophagae]
MRCFKSFFKHTWHPQQRQLDSGVFGGRKHSREYATILSTNYRISRSSRCKAGTPKSHMSVTALRE